MTAVWLAGVPPLPVGAVGAFVSPGKRTSNLENEPPPTVKLLLTAEVKLEQLAVSCLMPGTSISRFVYVTIPLPKLVPIFITAVPKRGPLPEESVIVTFWLPASPAFESLPNGSTVFMIGWIPNGEPAAAEPGCLANTNRVAGAGPMVIGVEVTLVRFVAVKVRLMVPVELYERSVKAASPKIDRKSTRLNSSHGYI